MKQSAQQNPNRGGPRRQHTTRLVVPGVMDTTASQLSILLNAMNGLLPYVMKGSALHFPGAEGAPIEMDGNAVEAASATAINITTRIDKILSEDERWNLAHVKDTTAQMREVADKQKGAIDEAMRPCMQLRPKLGYTPVHGMWVAVYQSEEGLVPLVGIGDSPDAALKNFDEQFKKTAKAYENTMDQRETGGTPSETKPGSKLPGFSDLLPPKPNSDLPSVRAKRDPRRPRGGKGPAGDNSGGGQNPVK